MTEIKQNTQNQQTTKAKTLKQLQLDLDRLEKKQEKEKQKLKNQINRKKLIQQNALKRTQRNKKIYNLGGLITTVFGEEDFDKLAEDSEFKEIFTGVLVNIKTKLSESEANKKNPDGFLERAKQKGKEFFNDLQSKKEENKKKVAEEQSDNTNTEDLNKKSDEYSTP